MKPSATALTKVNGDEQMLRLLGNCPIVLAYYSAKNRDMSWFWPTTRPKIEICHDCGPHQHFDATRGWWSQSYDMSRRDSHLLNINT